MPSREPSGIEVVLALPDRQHVARLPLYPGMTALDAVHAAGFLEFLPELDRSAPALGIHGRRVETGHLLRDGDRVEIYRPLANDPREARRRAAEVARQERRRVGRDRRGR